MSDAEKVGGMCPLSTPCSRACVFTQYENDKMGLGAYKERYTKHSCSFWPTYAPNRLSAAWGFAPDPTAGELTVLPRPLAGLGGEAARERAKEEGEKEGKG